MSSKHFPTEVLADIFIYLELGSHGQKQDLASVSRASHRFHDLIEPLLYSSLEDKKTGSLHGYLRTLLERPHLGRHVKLYKGWQPFISQPMYGRGVHCSRGTMNSIGKDTIPLPVYFSKPVREAVDNITSKEEGCEGWHKEIMGGSWHAITALVLSYIPNLQTLQLGITGNYDNWDNGGYRNNTSAPFFWLKRPFLQAERLQNQQISSPLALENLTSLNITRHNKSDRPMAHLGHLLPLLYVKSIKKFVAQDWYFTYWNCKPTPELSTKEMEFINSTFTYEFFLEDEDVFFEWFPHLEILRYRHINNDAQFHPKMITELIGSLIRLGTPLRELYLGDNNDWNPIFESLHGNREIADPSGDIEVNSFSSFENLEVLEMTAFDQWTRFNTNQTPLPPFNDMLPRSIKQITLYHASLATISYVRDLFENRYAVPELHTLRISCSQNEDFHKLIQELVSLKEDGKRCGINVVILKSFML